MKYSRKSTFKRALILPEIKFEDQKLTSFAGLVIYQPLLSLLNLKERLWACFRHLRVTPLFGPHIVTLLLIIHLLIGYRKLRDMDYYKDDPMVKRILGLNRMPDVSTVSRALSSLDDRSIRNLRGLCREMVLERLKKLNVKRLTLDFDGSVYSTSGKNKEGTAVGFNKQKKGLRSYYPLFCTIAQTGQVFDFHHRPGNVHDSNGAEKFISECLLIIREAFPGLKVEARLDSAFFNESIVSSLENMSVEFTVSVPFERFTELKKMIEGRSRWKYFNAQWSFFENNWKPKKWDDKYRFIFIRQKNNKIRKGPVQLDLFIPFEYGYDFKVIVTNKKVKTKKVLMFHNGRGAQENIFGELKDQCQMDYIPVRTLRGNQLYLVAVILAHNLTRELQMITSPAKQRGTTEKRTPLWKFEEMKSIRHNIIQSAGRFTRPKGKLTLSLGPNKAVKNDVLFFLDALKKAA